MGLGACGWLSGASPKSHDSKAALGWGREVACGLCPSMTHSLAPTQPHVEEPLVLCSTATPCP